MLRQLLLATPLIVSVAACGGEKKADPSVAEADKIYAERCETCHGKTGKGDGSGAASLDPKPRSFANQNWQKQTDDARIKKVIIEGGKANGFSEAMAPNPDLEGKPEVLSAIVKKIRRFAQ